MLAIDALTLNWISHRKKPKARSAGSKAVTTYIRSERIRMRRSQRSCCKLRTFCTRLLVFPHFCQERCNESLRSSPWTFNARVADIQADVRAYKLELAHALIGRLGQIGLLTWQYVIINAYAHIGRLLSTDEGWDRGMTDACKSVRTKTRTYVRTSRLELKSCFHPIGPIKVLTNSLKHTHAQTHWRCVRTYDL